MKNERKPDIKYANCYETIQITYSEEEHDSSNDRSTTPKYSSDNPESRKKRKSKWIKTDKRYSSGKILHQDSKNENQE